jgi:homocysteine S-methyltransferase
MNDIARPGLAALDGGTPFLSFAGNETFLLFQQGYALREFCAFEIVDDDAAWRRFGEEMVAPIVAAATAHGMGVVTDCLVWRASPDYLVKLGYRASDVARVNRAAVARVREAVRGAAPVILNADLGPRGDGYAIGAGGPLPADAARAYHGAQLAALADAGVDVVSALTMTSVAETIGVVRAAREHGLPVIVSPTVETDGRLPDGSTLGRFITEVDDATDGAPLFYMANCAHPEHIDGTLAAARAAGEGWLDRFRGFRANASRKSHAELDNATEIDRGDVEDLAARVAALRAAHDLAVVGGCCGTDAEHIAAIARACRAGAA